MFSGWLYWLELFFHGLKYSDLSSLVSVPTLWNRIQLEVYAVPTFQGKTSFRLVSTVGTGLIRVSGKPLSSLFFNVGKHCFSYV